MSSRFSGLRSFTDGLVHFHRVTGTMLPMTEHELIVSMCERLLAVCEASGLQKQEFAQSVGLSPQQLSNLGKHRNPPGHFVIAETSRIYGLPADFFYTGSFAGIRDDRIAAKLRAALSKPTA